MKVAVLFHGRLRPNETNHLGPISQLVKQHFTNHFNDVTYYGHFWDSSENKSKYNGYCDDENMIVESNETYQDYINGIKTNVLSYMDNDDYIKAIGPISANHCVGRMYAQISKLISINKVADILLSKNIQYDIIYIYRPDYIVYEEFHNELPAIDEYFCLNKHNEKISSGDNIFIVTQTNLCMFKDMLEHLLNKENKLVPCYHYWFYHYFVNIRNLKPYLLTYDVGKNCEQISLMKLYYNESNQIHKLLKTFNYFE